MATMREITDLRLPGGTARARWSGFVNEMITTSQPGEQWMPYRWRRAERESDRDVVQFERGAPSTTRMTVQLEYPGEPANSFVISKIRGSLRSDLERFCEGGECELPRAA
jgi:hypothetical protein